MLRLKYMVTDRAVIGSKRSKGWWKLSTLLLCCKVVHDWSINILFLLDGYIFAVFFETTSHCFRY